MGQVDKGEVCLPIRGLLWGCEEGSPPGLPAAGVIPHFYQAVILQEEKSIVVRMQKSELTCQPTYFIDDLGANQSYGCDG